MNLIPSAKLYELFLALNEELRLSNECTEMYMYGGAVLCLVYNLRSSTEDVDAVFKKGKRVYELSRKVARRFNVDPNWLNDEIHIIDTELKNGKYRQYLNLSNIKIVVPVPEQMLAMKLFSARGRPKHDFTDAIALCKMLNVNTVVKANRLYKKFIRVPLSDLSIRFISRVIEEVNKGV